MMKILPLLLSLMLFAGCSRQLSPAPKPSQPPESVGSSAPSGSAPQTEEEEKPPVIRGDQITDGTYEIHVDSSSSMFRVVRCVLTVSGGTMTADITMSGQGYGFVYMGTREEAAADSEENYIPFKLEEDGMKTFSVPVEALNQALNCAAWSIKKETWYDRTLVFESELLPPEALGDRP